MTPVIPDILARIVARKKDEVAEKSRFRKGLEQHARYQSSQRRDFAAALRAKRPSVIAEIKKASPSRGLLSEDFNPARQARCYLDGDASALSVLTDLSFFQGSLSDLKTARAAVPLPVLRKDFTIDEIDVIEAAAAGADAILLIAAILSEEQMRTFRELAATYGMAALVEVHADDELERGLASGAEIVGVNNRNLHTFDVDLATSERLAARIPAGILKVTESGIHTHADVERMLAAGFQSFLVGEHLMKSKDPAAALQVLLG